MVLETDNIEAIAIPEAEAAKVDDTPKPEAQKNKYTPRRKPAKKTPKNRLQWGD